MNCTEKFQNYSCCGVGPPFIPGPEPFFRTKERIDALVVEARSWVGTPWFPNGDTKGMGVSCQKLCSALYAAAGWRGIEVPEVAMAHAKFAKESLVEPWMEQRTEFVRVWETPAAGDMLGFRMRQVMHHCGVALQDGLFVHAMDGLGTSINSLSDGTWRGRLMGVWRPIE